MCDKGLLLFVNDCNSFLDSSTLYRCADINSVQGVLRRERLSFCSSPISILGTSRSPPESLEDPVFCSRSIAVTFVEPSPMMIHGRNASQRNSGVPHMLAMKQQQLVSRQSYSRSMSLQTGFLKDLIDSQEQQQRLREESSESASPDEGLNMSSSFSKPTIVIQENWFEQPQACSPCTPIPRKESEVDLFDTPLSFTVVGSTPTASGDWQADSDSGSFTSEDLSAMLATLSPDVNTEHTNVQRGSSSSSSGFSLSFAKSKSSYRKKLSHYLKQLEDSMQRLEQDSKKCKAFVRNINEKTRPAVKNYINDGKIEAANRNRHLAHLQICTMELQNQAVMHAINSLSVQAHVVKSILLSDQIPPDTQVACVLRKPQEIVDEALKQNGMGLVRFLQEKAREEKKKLAKCVEKLSAVGSSRSQRCNLLLTLLEKTSSLLQEVRKAQSKTPEYTSPNPSPFTSSPAMLQRCQSDSLEEVLSPTNMRQGSCPELPRDDDDENEREVNARKAQELRMAMVRGRRRGSGFGLILPEPVPMDFGSAIKDFYENQCKIQSQNKLRHRRRSNASGQVTCNGMICPDFVADSDLKVFQFRSRSEFVALENQFTSWLLDTRYDDHRILSRFLKAYHAFGENMTYDIIAMIEQFWRSLASRYLISAPSLEIALAVLVQGHIFSKVGVQQLTRISANCQFPDTLFRENRKWVSRLPPTAIDVEKQFCDPNTDITQSIYSKAITAIDELEFLIVPNDMLLCVFETCKYIIQDACNYAKVSTDSFGADCLVPLLVFVVASSSVQVAKSIIEFVQTLSSPEDIGSELGYYFVCFEVAVQFIIEADPNNYEQFLGSSAVKRIQDEISKIKAKYEKPVPLVVDETPAVQSKKSGLTALVKHMELADEMKHMGF
eukprot:c8768_g1_i1.p1 GENE.c8768_g1_i1~~c8768_g1_i1.p1  ORF type:complete len:936 (-),score=238.31 c8768_g1_i1:44-2719(-)